MENGNGNDRITRDDPSGRGSGLYNVGYSQGRRDAAFGSEDAGIQYIISCTKDGNKGYADGYNDYKERQNRVRERRERKND